MTILAMGQTNKLAKGKKQGIEWSAFVKNSLLALQTQMAEFFYES